MAFHIDFEPVGRRGTCPEGKTLLDHARLLGVDLVNLCGGTGSCGRCIVQVLEGEVNEPARGEGEFLTAEEMSEGYRLACRAIPQSDCKVGVPPESLTTPQRTQVEGEEISVEPEPTVTVYAVSLTAPSLHDLRADAERLLAELGSQHGVTASRLDTAILGDISTILRNNGWQIGVAVRDGEVVGLLPPGEKALGLAVDLGTTKIAAYLLELESGQTLAAKGAMNPQISYGEDVVSRLAIASRDPEEADHLQALLVQALNRVAKEMCDEVGRDTNLIIEAVVVGNTAIHHLFLKLPVEQLAMSPYVPAVAAALDVKARELGLAFGAGAYVHLLPNIAGYVGADHVSMLLASGVGDMEGVVLALDIGTNTEVCLNNHGRMTSLSCASGPAFEGAHISHGMRAAHGAIEHVRLVEGLVEYQTIGDIAPTGLCGSGILDALAQLVQAGVVDRRGRMGQHALVQDKGQGLEFLLVGAGAQERGAPDGAGEGTQEITFTQKDVRELQLAKGAMRTGIQVLLSENDLTEKEIDRVIIAGAFGTYIDVTSAQTIGMLPRVPVDRVRQIGNAAGMGAKLALISRSKRAEAHQLADRIGYVELGSIPSFGTVFAMATFLE